MLATIDLVAPRIMTGCDVLIGMSGMTAATAEVVRRRYGARIIVERGSRHILSQQEILVTISGRSARAPIDERTIRRELADYAVADRIVVPAEHVLRSFIERGTPRERLFVNPYGVDLSMFPPTPAPPSNPLKILFVGAWSFRKGCDVLTEAWRCMDRVHLLHVGPLDDAPVPRDPGFEHRNPVPQFLLSAEYARGHVFALASREEGLALVQLQALASGLPLVCTDRSGGEDAGRIMGPEAPVTVVPSDDPKRLSQALASALERAILRQGLRDYGEARERLSWSAYGERYHRALMEMA
jgi:glycosyltransferase involved in cell wall biosynthesis